MLPIKQFEEAVKKGLPAPLYFIYSLEKFFLLEAVSLIRENLDALSIESFDSPDEVDISALRTTHSLFADRRILIIHNYERIKKEEKRIEFIKRLRRDLSSYVSAVILSNTSKGEIQRELQFMKEEKINIFNLDLVENQLYEWIQYKAWKKGITLSRSAIIYLIEITNAEAGLISSEIEKIAILSDTKDLSVTDIKEILSDRGKYEAFDLIEAIKGKDFEKAFRILEQMKNTDADLLLGALNWYYSKIPEADSGVFYLLLRANLGLRQARHLTLEMLLYELLRE